MSPACKSINVCEAVVTAIETMNQATLTVVFVKVRLLDEFNKGKNYTSVNYVTNHNSSAFNAHSNNYKLRCHNCGRAGHKHSHCRLKPQNKIFNKYTLGASGYSLNTNFNESRNSQQFANPSTQKNMRKNFLWWQMEIQSY